VCWEIEGLGTSEEQTEDLRVKKFGRRVCKTSSVSGGGEKVVAGSRSEPHQRSVAEDIKSAGRRSQVKEMLREGPVIRCRCVGGESAHLNKRKELALHSEVEQGLVAARRVSDTKELWTLRKKFYTGLEIPPPHSKEERREAGLESVIVITASRSEGSDGRRGEERQMREGRSREGSEREGERAVT
jgi:hypothetical protein